MARSAIILMALCCSLGMSSAAITWVVNSATDTAAPGSSCSSVCNVRTAWSMANNGDTILVQVDPLMKAALSDWRGKTGKITIKGQSMARGGGNVIVSPAAAGSNAGFINFPPGFNYSVTIENMDFEKFSTMAIYVFGSDTSAAAAAAEHNTLAQAAGRARTAHPRPIAHRSVGQAKQLQVILIRYCKFRQNTVSDTGAVAVWAFNGLVAVHNCQFIDNTSGGNFGGALFAWDVSDLDVKDTEFIRNTGQLSIVGGEVVNKFYITGCTFQDNAASNMFTGYGVGPGGILNIHSTSFLANKVPSALVWGGNFSATWVTATIAPDQSIVHEVAGGKVALYLDGCTFQTTDGSPLSITRQPAVIFNRDPGNLNLNSTVPVQTCAEVPAGPLPCSEGTKCMMVKNPSGKDIGYDCPVATA